MTRASRFKVFISPWITIAITLALAFTLNGCGGGDESAESSESAAQAESSGQSGSMDLRPADISRKSDRIVISMNNGPYEDEKDKLTEHFLIEKMWRERHPGVDIKVESWQYDPQVFIPKVQSGTATDIVGMFATEGAMVIQKGLAEDLTGLINDWDMGPYIIPEIMAPYSREGRIYAVPVGDLAGAYVMSLFYNKDIFREAGIVDENGEPKPPHTWEEFVDTAKKLTDRDAGRAGFGILGDADAAGWHFLNWVWQSGGEFQERQPNGTWKSVFDSPEAIRALQFVKDLRWKHNVLQYNVTCNNDDLMEMFVSERIAMSFFAPENMIYLYDKYEMDINKIGITVLPAGPAGRANQMGGNFNIIVEGTPPEKKKLAFEFLTFLYEPELVEARCKLLKKQGRVVGVPSLPVFQPEKQEILNDIIDKYRTFPSYEEVMAEAAKHVRAEPPNFCQALYSEFLSPAVQKVLIDKDANPAAIMTEKNEQFQRQYLDDLNEEILAGQ